MNIKAIAGILFAAVLAGCATTTTSVEPELPQAKGDPNPYADYERGMASDAKLPMAVEWHNANADALAKETNVEALKKYVMLPKSADDLLAQVKMDYKTDPMVATKIAAVSQLVMCPKWGKAPAAREIWTCALLGAAEKAPDGYRKMFFLDQLRWCGKKTQSAKVLAIGEKSGCKEVADFAKMVASELK